MQVDYKAFRVAFAAIIVALVGVAGSASAITYGADLVLLKEGGQWQVHVEGFQPGDVATVRLVCEGATDVELGQVTAIEDGTIDQLFALPEGTDIEKCQIGVKGGAIDKTFTLNLPATGTTTTGTVAIAAALVAVGGVIVAASSLGKRKARTAPQA
jgi:hypothetical protein